MIQKTLLVAVLLLTSLMTRAQEQPKYEIRAVWLTTLGGLDWPRTRNVKQQKAELTQTLDQLKDAGINTVLFQTRIRATTAYPSKIEPWAEYFTGTAGRSPGYDPLKFAIDECHKRGMQLHAWVVTIPVGKWNKNGCTQLHKKHPDLICKIGEDGFMNPEKPATASYIANCCREIVENYDVDGIHLDYIRYPETWPKTTQQPKAKGKGRKKAAGNVATTKLTSAKTRRAYITNIVRTIHETVKSVKPWVMLSCSPIGKHADLTRYRSGGWNARDAVYQDAQQWLKDSIMDALFPMMYFRDNNFYPFAIDWQEQSSGRIVVPGLGTYFLDPKEGRWSIKDIEREMHVLRQLGMGHCHFRSKFLTDNTQGIYDFTSRFNAIPALIPPMTWASARIPEAPVSLQMKAGRLCWQDTTVCDSLQYHLYNIYASADFPVNTDKAENLVAARLNRTSVNVPDNKLLNYAVTATDRYGQESKPCQLLLNAGEAYTVQSIVLTDGQLVRLPQKPSIVDAEYVVIETLLGQQIQYQAYKNVINVTQLPDGIYQIRSLGKKGRNHRIGFFSIKRHQ